MSEVTSFGEPLGDGQTRTRMATIEDVVGRLRATREATDAIELPERTETLQPTGEELVRVGLVAGIPDEPVTRRFEQAVERDGQFHDPE